MNKPIGWRVGVTLAVLLGSIGAYWWRGHEALKKSPTAPPNPSMSEVLRNGLKLGLDLKGGIHLVLQVKTADALRVEAQDTLEHLKDEGTKRGIAVTPAGPADGTGFTLKLDEKTDQAKLKDLVKSILPPNSWSVDERGREWKIGFKDVERNAIEDQATRQAVETIRNRVDALGVAEPVIQRQGTDRIVVEIPGVDDPSRVKEIIGTTGLLELTLVDDRGGPYPTAEGAKAAYGGTIPEDLRLVEGLQRGRRRADAHAGLLRPEARRRRHRARHEERPRGPRQVQPARRHVLPERAGRREVREGHRREHQQAPRDRPRQPRHVRPEHQQPDQGERHHRGQLHGREGGRARARPALGRAARPR